jgi:hypothetical protein
MPIPCPFPLVDRAPGRFARRPCSLQGFPSTRQPSRRPEGYINDVIEAITYSTGGDGAMIDQATGVRWATRRPSAERKLMQAKGFFGSLFDYSFSSFITSRIVKVLYVLTTIVVALWTLVIILLAFKASATLGILALLIIGPIFFVIAMIYVRVGLELLMVIFRIHENVEEINQRAGGARGTPVASAAPPPETGLDPAVTATVAEPTSEAAPVTISSPAPEPAAAPSPVARFCENCGTERSPGKAFCTGCGKPLD